MATSRGFGIWQSLRKEIGSFNIDLIAVCNTIAEKGKRVIVSGLDMDFLGKPFGIMPSLLAVADKITKLHAICSDCSNTANYSFRLTKNKSLISEEIVERVNDKLN